MDAPAPPGKVCDRHNRANDQVQKERALQHEQYQPGRHISASQVAKRGSLISVRFLVSTILRVLARDLDSVLAPRSFH